MQKKRSLFLVVTLATTCSLAASVAGATTTPTNIINEIRDEAASSGAYDVLVRADEILNALTYTVYATSSMVWDTDDGVYLQDCSGHVNHILDEAVPEAYDEFRDARDVTRPSASDYYYFFRSIALGEKLGRWRRPYKLADSRPGDLIVWRYTTAQASGSGHVMVIVSVPVRDTRWSNVYRVRVTDSARSGHSNDNRGSSGSGVGAGEMLFKVDSNGQPVQYAWSLGAYSWHSDVSLAIGRPRY